MLICDTSALLAFFDASDEHHASVAEVIAEDPGPFLVSPYVIAELDYLLATRRGVNEQIAVLKELAGGAWELADCKASELAGAIQVLERYRDQEVGAADASLIVLAARRRTLRLLTLDHRHFRVLHSLEGRPFTLLPADS